MQVRLWPLFKGILYVDEQFGCSGMYVQCAEGPNILAVSNAVQPRDLLHTRDYPSRMIHYRVYMRLFISRKTRRNYFFPCRSSLLVSQTHQMIMSTLYI